jgi:hypothetical protein
MIGMSVLRKKIIGVKMDTQLQPLRNILAVPLVVQPLAVLPLERQVDLLGQQVIQQQQLLAVQQYQLAAFADVQVNLEAQSAQQQAIALETYQVADQRIANAEEALTVKTQECLAKDTRIALLEAQLASQPQAYVMSLAAAQETIETQKSTINTLSEKVDILSEAFTTMEQVMGKVSAHRLHGTNWLYSNPLQRFCYIRDACVPAFNVLTLQITKTRTELQENIQSKHLKYFLTLQEKG